jgi:heterodisulfide reductase subunit A
MRIGCYVCRCGQGQDGQVSSRIDVERLMERLRPLPGVAYVADVDIACGEAGQERIAEHLRAQRPDRVVIAACSPREHGVTFTAVMRDGCVNPYLCHLVNIREQVAWVTEGPGAALDKAETMIRAGVARVGFQEPLESVERDVSTDVLVIGGGPAGHRAALTLAEAGRHVTVVERSGIVGGVPVRIEDLFPAMECAPCLLEPLTGELLHGEHPGPIDVHLLSEVTSCRGSLGNFTVGIRHEPRYVTSECVGCGECVAACPAALPDPLKLGRAERKAIDFELFGGLPSIPVLDASACRRFAGDSADDAGCTACRDACPIDGSIVFDDERRTAELTVGAIVVATGAGRYDATRLSGLGYGEHPDILTSWEFERLLAANGPTGGELRTADGRVPRTIAVVNCAGSLDDDHVPYCSGICCQLSLKFHHLIEKKSPEVDVICYYKQFAVPGKEAFGAYEHARADPGMRLVRYGDLRELKVLTAGGRPKVTRTTADGEDSVDADLVVLMTPVVPSQGLRELAEVLDIGRDRWGFLRELNGRSATTSSSVRGIVIAGSCQSPMDLASAMTQGTAAAGQVLAALVDGRKLVLDPATASVDAERCSGCLSCLLVCPYTAIALGEGGTVAVDAALCTGCGTCVAACPCGAMTARHFLDEAITAEIMEALR